VHDCSSDSISSAITDVHTPTNVEHDELKICAAAAAARTTGIVNLLGAAHRRYDSNGINLERYLGIPREFGHKMLETLKT